MGLGGISLAQLLVLLLIVFAVFGTRKLRGVGEDLGKAVKSFRDAMNDSPAAASKDESTAKSLPEQE